jgi:glutamate--cysteine ligase catalytic subunit
MLGNDGNNPGIINLIDRYLDEQDISESTKQILKSHVHLIRQRVTGERKTGATWMREFIQKHPKYQHDSIITHEINYDLMQAILHLESSDLLNS